MWQKGCTKKAEVKINRKTKEPFNKYNKNQSEANLIRKKYKAF